MYINASVAFLRAEVFLSSNQKSIKGTAGLRLPSSSPPLQAKLPVWAVVTHPGSVLLSRSAVREKETVCV
jgi:hypothetical protein